jgi:hypothetical protein
MLAVWNGMGIEIGGECGALPWLVGFEGLKTRDTGWLSFLFFFYWVVSLQFFFFYFFIIIINWKLIGLCFLKVILKRFKFFNLSFNSIFEKI